MERRLPGAGGGRRMGSLTRTEAEFGAMEKSWSRMVVTAPGSANVLNAPGRDTENWLKWLKLSVVSILPG